MGESPDAAQPPAPCSGTYQGSSSRTPGCLEGLPSRSHSPTFPRVSLLPPDPPPRQSSSSITAHPWGLHLPHLLMLDACSLQNLLPSEPPAHLL